MRAYLHISSLTRASWLAHIASWLAHICRHLCARLYFSAHSYRAPRQRTALSRLHQHFWRVFLCSSRLQNDMVWCLISLLLWGCWCYSVTQQCSAAECCGYGTVAECDKLSAQQLSIHTPAACSIAGERTEYSLSNWVLALGLRGATFGHPPVCVSQSWNTTSQPLSSNHPLLSIKERKINKTVRFHTLKRLFFVNFYYY